MFRRGQDFSRNFCRKLHFFKVSRSFECLIFPGLTTIRLKSSVVTIPMMSNHLFFLLVHLVLPIFCSINKNWFLKNFEKNPKTGQCLAGQCFADYCICNKQTEIYILRSWYQHFARWCPFRTLNMAWDSLLNRVWDCLLVAKDVYEILTSPGILEHEMVNRIFSNES